MSFAKQHELGIIGLALLRNWLVGDNRVSLALLDELRGITSFSKYDKEIHVNSLDPISGYKNWSEVYDKNPNLLIEVEEPVVTSILSKDMRRGSALDLACGTGRYSKILDSLGFDVVGVDRSEEMLNKSKRNNPGLDYVLGEMIDIPMGNDSVDLLVCGLALTHLPDINKPISEMARVVKEGGKVVISDIHPWIVSLGGQADFYDDSGNYAYINNYVHWHSKYLQCFKKNKLRVVGCFEPEISKNQIELIKIGFDLKDETVATAFEGLPLALVWELEKI